MSSKAVRMGDELLRLAQGKAPGSSDWKTEIHFKKTPPKGSWNKYLVCNAAELLDARRRDKPHEVKAALDWWQWYAETQTVCGGESLTCEEVYRTSMVYGIFVAAAVARAEHHPGAEALRLFTRAHVAWLVIGAGGPGRKVNDHHLGNVSVPCVLVGDGVFVTTLPYVSQAGARGWVRNRESGPKKFHFTERTGLSALVGQAAAFNVPRNGLGLGGQIDMFTAACNLSPGIAPLGFSDADRSNLRDFLRNTGDIRLARIVFSWIEAFAPSQPHTFIRYADGSVLSFMGESSSSSTDPCMIDLWMAGGKTYKTSADDGLRSDSYAQVCSESPTRVTCLNKTNGMTSFIDKPTVAEAYRVASSGSIVRFVQGSSGTIVPPTATTNPPANNQVSKPVANRKKKWWHFWL